MEFWGSGTSSGDTLSSRSRGFARARPCSTITVLASWPWSGSNKKKKMASTNDYSVTTPSVIRADGNMVCSKEDMLSLFLCYSLTLKWWSQVLCKDISIIILWYVCLGLVGGEMLSFFCITKCNMTDHTLLHCSWWHVQTSWYQRKEPGTTLPERLCIYWLTTWLRRSSTTDRGDLNLDGVRRGAI